MTNTILDKTDKGREEIATRKFGLAPRLRSLLVIIDGKRDVTDLLNKVTGLGLKIESITELIEKGFVQIIAGPNPQHEQAIQHSPPVKQIINASLTTQHASQLEISDHEASTSPTSISVNQYKALHAFFNETIKSTLGLRGFVMQLKVERATSMNDFLELRQPYLDAVQKASGNEIAQSLAVRLDELLKPRK